MTTSTLCQCGHAAGIHTYTTRGLGECLSGPEAHRCPCDLFDEEDDS